MAKGLQYIAKSYGLATRDFLTESHLNGQTPNCKTANFSAESLTFKYLISDLSNSNESLHGALVNPVISKSIDTKSAALTCRLKSSRDDSKFDLVTCFKGNCEFGSEAVQTLRDGEFRARDNALNESSLLIATTFTYVGRIGLRRRLEKQFSGG